MVGISPRIALYYIELLGARAKSVDLEWRCSFYDLSIILAYEPFDSLFGDSHAKDVGYQEG